MMKRAIDLGLSAVLLALGVACATGDDEAPVLTGGYGGSAGAISGGGGGQGGIAGTGGAGGASGTGGAGGMSGAGGGGASGGTGGSSASGGTGGGGGAMDDGGMNDGSIDMPPDCQGGKVVHFVYFVEADQEFSEQLRADVEDQAFRFQQFWYDQLGVTFYLNYPVVDVIEADHEAAWYLTTPDGIHGDERWYRLGNIKKEVYGKLGIDDFDDDHRVVNYPTTRHDGRVGANFGGAWMDGDDLACIHDNGFNFPYADGNSAHCTGHVAHEFGHVLGLDHTGPNDDCMRFGFYTSDPDDLCDFSPDNVAIILGDADNEGWLEAMPGETCTGL